MNKIGLIILTVLTASIELLDFADTSASPALYDVENPDDVEDDSESVIKSKMPDVLQGSGLPYRNINRGRPQLQVQGQSSQKHTSMFLDVVECHVCVDCPHINETITTKLCPHTLDVTRQNRCVTYAERYKHMKRPWYVRGCASERGSCDDIRNAHADHSEIVQLISCNECEGHKCNSNNGCRSLSDITFSIFAVIIVPVAGKCILS